MLSMRRDAIRGALVASGQTWREDSSNNNLDYRRNWMRKQVIPMLETQFPKAAEAVLRAIDGQQQWLSTIQNTSFPSCCSMGSS